MGFKELARSSGNSASLSTVKQKLSDVEVTSQSVRAGAISDELDVSRSPDSGLMGRRIPALSGCLSTSLSPARENTSDLAASLCLLFHSA